MNVYIIMLRQPRGADDPRHDPFWEFGSFGRTGCHKRNLLHPRRSPVRAGDRVAFLQGGAGESRIVGLTPPLRDIGGVQSGQRLELLWDPSFRPTVYDEAPLLIDNAGRSDFPLFRASVRLGRCRTLVQAVSSGFRSRCQALAPPIAAELVTVCSAWRGRSAPTYIDAVEPAGGRWSAGAARRGWADPAPRRREFAQRG
ncbi:MAG TPA: hypothetical protein VFA75_00250 [Nevskia sp.]|nr:hypothetical protein [Nevskia sp.]